MRAHIAETERVAAEARRGAANAEERAGKVEIELEKQRQETAKANERAGALELAVAEGRERAANAERALLELQQRVADRRLTADQRATIRAALVAGGPPGGDISVTCLGPDPEPCRFAAEIVDVMRLAGWLVDFGPNSQLLPIGTISRGVFVRVQNPDTPRAAVLQTALTAAGITAVGVVRTDAAEDWVDLLVAFKPQP